MGRHNMRTLYFKDSELVLDSKGNIKVITGLESLVENIDQRLKLFKNKYFMDKTAGVPYFEDIIKKPVDPGLVASILNTEILKESEVTGIGSVEIDLDAETRKFNYNAQVKSIFGNFEVNI